MLNRLWESTETYISYNDVVDKWGMKSAIRVEPLDVLSAAVALNLVFPEVTVIKITKDLALARVNAIRDSKEIVR